MKHGFIKGGSGNAEHSGGGLRQNTDEIFRLVREMSAHGAKIMGFPELCITGYTCQDLFWQNVLLDSAKERLLWLADETENVDGLIVVGLPLEVGGKLYNAAAVPEQGKDSGCGAENKSSQLCRIL